MASPDRTLRIDYETHAGVRRLIEWVRYALEGISVEFDDWDDEYVRGPGMYVAVVSGRSVAEYADPMGSNRWPIDRCRTIEPGRDEFKPAAETVARTRDGAVVISVDGVVKEQMVRFRYPRSDERSTEYADWMGSRHMSALDTSARPEVVATLTLSGENGRVTVFHDGTYETTPRERLGERWRVSSEDTV